MGPGTSTSKLTQQLLRGYAALRHLTRAVDGSAWSIQSTSQPGLMQAFGRQPQVALVSRRILLRRGDVSRRILLRRGDKRRR